MKKVYYILLAGYFFTLNIQAQVRNTGTDGAPEQPDVLYLGDQGVFGCESPGVWDNVYWSQWQVCISQNEDIERADIYGVMTPTSGNSYSDVVHKQATSPVFTSTGTWYWGIKIIYGDAKTGWYCRDSRYEPNYPHWVPTEGTVGIGNWMWIWDHAYEANLTVEVLPIPDPDNFTANGTTLSWVKNEPGHDVVIVKTDDPAWAPAQGSSIPGENVVYAGDGTSCSLLENTSIYKIYSVNNNYYSSGITYIPDGYSLDLTEDVTLLGGDLYLSSQSELTSVGSLLTAGNIYLKVTVENSDEWNF
ncbi:MAG: hypothetical protein LBH61_05660, partial [Dysgonamonadaceae bacterium]|nr:hypothetical protein [Dysgonamonadaceae bacterium]